MQIINYRYPNGLLPVPRNSQRIVFVDPPYNIGIEYADDPTKDKMPESLYREWCGTVMRQLERTMLPGATLWWLCPADHLWIRDLLRYIFPSRSPVLIIKEEPFTQYNSHTLTIDYRLLWVSQKDGDPGVFNADAIRIPSVRQEMGDPRADPRGRLPGSIWKFRRLQGTAYAHVDWHNAQLPPELFERIIVGWSNAGDSVLDAFAGSGGMGVVAKRLGREYVGIDGSPTYCAKIKERLS